MLSRKKKKKLLWMVIILILLSLVSGFSYTRSNNFCTSCHSMHKYSSTIAIDYAHKDAACVDCHTYIDFPIKYVSHLSLVGNCVIASFKDESEHQYNAFVRDSNCMATGCHNNEDWDAETSKRSKDCYKYFSHHTHFDTILSNNLHCTSCHVGASETAKSPHFEIKLNNCFSCHLNNSESFNKKYPSLKNKYGCFTCHPKDMLTEKIGHENLSRNNDHISGLISDNLQCYMCHSLNNRQSAPVSLKTCRKCHPDHKNISLIKPDTMHSNHVFNKKIDCSDCHIAPPHSTENKKTVITSCMKCHLKDKISFEIAYEVYHGNVLGFISPDPMAKAGVDCSTCHKYGRGDNNKSCSDGLRSCTICHIASYSKLPKTWQKTIKNRMSQLMQLIKQAQEKNIFKEIPINLGIFIEYLKADNSLGVHNISNINDTLTKSIKTIRDMISQAGK